MWASNVQTKHFISDVLQRAESRQRWLKVNRVLLKFCHTEDDLSVPTTDGPPPTTAGNLSKGKFSFKLSIRDTLQTNTYKWQSLVYIRSLFLLFSLLYVSSDFLQPLLSLLLGWLMKILSYIKYRQVCR